MSIMQGNDMVESPGEQKIDDFFRRQLVSDGPPVLIKPFPNRGKEVVREKVNMGIDNAGQGIGNIAALRVIYRRKRSFQHSRINIPAGMAVFFLMIYVGIRHKLALGSKIEFQILNYLNCV